MDTPELNDPRPETQALAQAASQKNLELVSGRTVRLERDVSETDKYGRLLRYVYVGEMFINAELVRLGYARVVSYPPDVKNQELLLSFEREAREAGRGLWSSPSPTRTPTPTAVSQEPSASLQVVSVTSPARPGTDATLIARTAPGAQCSITVIYKSGPSTAAGLLKKSATTQGDISWTWRVGTNTTPGDWPIIVTCDMGGISVTQQTSFTVR